MPTASSDTAGSANIHSTRRGTRLAEIREAVEQLVGEEPETFGFN